MISNVLTIFSQKQQQKMAHHCRTILGDLLLKGNIDSHPVSIVIQ